jgi:hypothetical protein
MSDVGLDARPGATPSCRSGVLRNDEPTSASDGEDDESSRRHSFERDRLVVMILAGPVELGRHGRSSTAARSGASTVARRPEEHLRRAEPGALNQYGNS